MTLKTTSAYITTVGPDHTIVLPDDIAVGATVAVVLMPLSAETERQARFAATLAAVRAASTVESVDQNDQPTPSSLYGILSHLGGDVAPTETLDETRRELWSAWERDKFS